MRKLDTDYLDVFKLGWLGKTSIYSKAIIDALLKLKQEGKILSIGTSIHDRKRAGRLALSSEVDLLMIRYNAKHPGAEQDIFPYLSKRNPAGQAVWSISQIKKKIRLREVKKIQQNQESLSYPQVLLSKSLISILI